MCVRAYDDNVDSDGDGIPDGCDPIDNNDDDNDGVNNSEDVCPGFDDNSDSDGDGIPDGCDTPDVQPNVPPTILEPQLSCFFTGDSVNVTVLATDPDDSVLRHSFQNLPPGCGA